VFSSRRNVNTSCSFTQHITLVASRLFSNRNRGRGAYSQRDSPGGSMLRGQRTFRHAIRRPGILDCFCHVAQIAGVSPLASTSGDDCVAVCSYRSRVHDCRRSCCIRESPSQSRSRCCGRTRHYELVRRTARTHDRGTRTRRRRHRLRSLNAKIDQSISQSINQSIVNRAAATSHKC